MKIVSYLIAIVVFFPNYAFASWYENCVFKASVVSEITEDEENKLFKIEVLTASSYQGGYTDCKLYINQVIDVVISHKEAKRYKQLAKGETIRIFRIATDEFIDDVFHKRAVEFRSKQ